MNGAQALFKALTDAGLDTCFANPGTSEMQSMLELDRPSIDWVHIATGMGLPAVAVDSAEAFHAEFERAMAQRGPMLIEATIAQDLQPIVDLILQQKAALGGEA